jgi:UDP-glucuronate 4-epimerase
MEERFLVTGSEGCLGSWVVKELAERGISCVALDLESRAERLRYLLHDDRLLGTVTFLTGDIVEEGVLERAVAEHGVTRIIHLAALQIPFVAADPIRGALVNVVGTLRTFEAARRSRGQVRGLVYASSAAVYGSFGRERRPTTLYGVFKGTNEDCATIYWHDEGVASVGLRPWAVFGPGRDQGLTAAPTNAMKAGVLGLPYRIPFDGRLDLQYAPDVAETFVRAAFAEPGGASCYDLRGTVVSLEDLVRVIEEVWPAAQGLITWEGDQIPIESELDDAPLQARLGDVPRTDLPTAVRETMEHFSALHEAGRLKPAITAPTLEEG